MTAGLCKSLRLYQAESLVKGSRRSLHLLLHRTPLERGALLRTRKAGLSTMLVAQSRSQATREELSLGCAQRAVFSSS